MVSTTHKSVSVCIVAILATVCGCSKSETTAGTGANAATAPVISPLDPQRKALGDAQSKGREEDAKRTAAAMQKAQTP